MKFSDNQNRAKSNIEYITDHFGKDRWFIKGEISGCGQHTINALVTKGVLETQYFEGKAYYRIKPQPSNQICAGTISKEGCGKT